MKIYILTRGIKRAMSVLKRLKLFRLILVIVVFLIFFTTFPSIVQGDNWVLLDTNEDYSCYYNSSSIKIDKTNNIIMVWTKNVYTDKGKNGVINEFVKRKVDIDKIKNVDYKYIYFSIYYMDLKYCINKVTLYSKNGMVLLNYDIPDKLVEEDISPDSIMDKLMNILLKEYHIKK